MPQKDEVELDIINVAHGGVFVARHEGRVVFVPDTLPGERVRARVADRAHDRFWRAELLEVLEPAAERREHVWDAASVRRAPGQRAGGAEFGHIRLDHQRELKRRVIVDALQRTARLDAETIDALGVDGAGPAVEAVSGETEDGTGWRTRVRLQVGEEGAIGPFAARTHTIVPVTDLPLATATVEESAPFGQRFPGAESVDVVATGSGATHVLVNDRPERRGKRLIRPRRRPVPIRERVGEREFRLDARGFWQVHRQAAATLTEAVRSAVDEALFDPRAANLDLYGGVGLLAAALGDRFGPTLRITSVEADEAATDDAAENLAEWVGATAVTARVERFVTGLAAEATAAERSRLRAATVVLDPPRSGAGREVVDAIASMRPAQVVYVACDPVALARDVAYFAERGYPLRTLRAFDLFPNTHHVEAVATLTP
ncbi:class I SAM-dependent RNA methyltransferase [Leifsonia shinshuensis]|uniref:tRNA/tmRNA/rRNA uracil-C5-methylase (TrmA/RlmC/RlmD family) n=1 Tax=Leifsonia shinshuensis TaxID=150026 RepID=A0A853CYV8_9MICO|nr:TRAM domain-containing protein [Leifsonia shinshuensis]NYJ25093.1 tRNA/tmRNA/rRNA uracil-C5-methylase (TrmA/RlmC/RlmD family) [Leifsonia shinshuensis]